MLAYLEQTVEADVLDYAKHYTSLTICPYFMTSTVQSIKGMPEIEKDLDMYCDFWAILSAKASGKALDKIKSVPQGEGL